MLPPTIYAPLPPEVRAVVLPDGTCVFNNAVPRSVGVVLTYVDVVDRQRALASLGAA